MINRFVSIDSDQMVTRSSYLISLSSFRGFPSLHRCEEIHLQTCTILANLAKRHDLFGYESRLVNVLA